MIRTGNRVSEAATFGVLLEKGTTSAPPNLFVRNDMVSASAIGSDRQHN
jgi:hypothetical protein